MPGYLDHHGFRRGKPEPSRTEGPPCEVCGRKMLAGQKRRHGLCSPPLDCCGTPEDLVPNIQKHIKEHDA